jgi:hypothetical protein
MNRLWVALALALIVSTPLVPPSISASEHWEEVSTSGPRTHGLTRIVLTSIGLNGLAEEAWLTVLGMMEPRSMPSYGASDRTPC